MICGIHLIQFWAALYRTILNKLFWMNCDIICVQSAGNIHLKLSFKREMWSRIKLKDVLVSKWEIWNHNPQWTEKRRERTSKNGVGGNGCSNKNLRHSGKNTCLGINEISEKLVWYCLILGWHVSVIACYKCYKSLRDTF